MKRIITCLIAVLLLTACGPAPAQQPTPDIVATSQVVSETMVAATLTAFRPTETLPPTSTVTSTATPKASDTPVPTRTRAPKATSVPSFSGCFTPAGVSKETAPFKIENMTKNKIVVFINGKTRKGEHPIHCAYTIKKNRSVIFTIWWGDYTYLVQVPGRTSYDGSFWVNNDDKATMRIFDHDAKFGPFP